MLDPELTLGLPAAGTAATGIDAMVHATEVFTSKHKKNPISDQLAKRALALLSQNIRPACRGVLARSANSLRDSRAAAHQETRHPAIYDAEWG